MKNTDLKARNLNVWLNHREILRDITLEFEPGTVTAIVGPNGCGKSTLLRALLGFVPPAKGDVLLDGTPISGIPARERARRIAYLPQSPHAPEGLRVRTLVERGRTPYMRPFQPLSQADRLAVDEALELTGLTDLAARRLDRLSGGQRQRAWIALSMAQKTPLLVLDEPTTYLDLPFQIEVLRLVRRLCDESGKTIVMVLHDVNLASHYADRIVALKHGKIAFEGSPKTVVTEANLAALFDMPLRIDRPAGQSRPYVLPL